MSEKKMPELKPLVDALKDKKGKREAIKEKYKSKDKVKKLSTAERLNRIEEYLGLDE